MESPTEVSRLVDQERVLELPEHALGQNLHGGHRGVPLQQHELVATDAREQRAGADAAIEALGRRLQQHVAGGVSHAVVDCLEAIQVDAHQGERLAAPAEILQRRTQAFGEGLAVRQAGEQVVACLVGRAGLGAARLGDVGADAPIADEVLVLVEDRPAGERPPAQRPLAPDRGPRCCGTPPGRACTGPACWRRWSRRPGHRDGIAASARSRSGACPRTQDCGRCNASARPGVTKRSRPSASVSHSQRLMRWSTSPSSSWIMSC